MRDFADREGADVRASLEERLTYLSTHFATGDVELLWDYGHSLCWNWIGPANERGERAVQLHGGVNYDRSSRRWTTNT